MAKRRPSFSNAHASYQLEVKRRQGPKQPTTMEEFANGASAGLAEDSEGMMKLDVNIRSAHHVALQVEAQKQDISISQLVHKMIEQLSKYQIMKS